MRASFEKKGEVTDVRIVRNKEGKSRQLAFVGFRTESQAQEALSYFNNTFIDNSRVILEVAKKIGDASLSESLSRYTKLKLKRKLKESPETNDSETPIENDIHEIKTEDKVKVDFMEAMKNRRQAHKWANDEGIISTEGALALNQEDKVRYEEEIVNGQKTNVNSTQNSLAASAVSDLEYLRSKVRKGSLSDSDSDSSDEDESIDFDSLQTEKTNSKFLKKNKEEILENNETVSVAKEDEVTEGDVMEESGRLFVRNLPFSCSEDELTSLFTSYGPVSETHLPLDSERKGKGIGFIQYLIPEHAKKALESLDGSSFQGRVIHVMYAKSNRPLKEEGNNEGIKEDKSKRSAFQKQREDNRRKLAAKKDGWNASYVRSDTVVEALVEK